MNGHEKKAAQAAAANNGQGKTDRMAKELEWRSLPVEGGVTFTAAAPQLSSPKSVQLQHFAGEKLLGTESHVIDGAGAPFQFRSHPAETQVCYAFDDDPAGDLSLQITSRGRYGPTPLHLVNIGAMKAGTSTLYASLKQHPQICVNRIRFASGLKESDHFIKTKYYEFGDASYAWRFSFQEGVHKATLDASPNYSKWPKAHSIAARMERLATDVRLIYLMRDPVTRLESHVNHNIALGRLERGAVKLRGLTSAIIASSYALQLDQFRRFFRDGKLLLVDFDELVASPQQVSYRICDFAGLDRVHTDVPAQNQTQLKPAESWRLNKKGRRRLRELLRADMERLIGDYGFKPAEKWL